MPLKEFEEELFTQLKELLHKIFLRIPRKFQMKFCRNKKGIEKLFRKPLRKKMIFLNNF